jgi:3-dehydroquinate synthetase
MAFSTTMSCLSGRIDASNRDRILDAIQRLGLAIWHPAVADIDMLQDAQKMMYAKRGGHGLWAVLPTGIGRCDYAQDVSITLLKDTINLHRRLSAARQHADGIDRFLD